MLRYLSDMLSAYPDFQVRQYLVYIGKDKLNRADGFVMHSFSYRFEIIDMHKVAFADLLGKDSPDAWVLAVLCDFQDRLPRDIDHALLSNLSKICRRLAASA